jgi:hypothetical protein
MLLRSTWSTSVNTAVLAPMPNAMDSTATMAKAGAFKSPRRV